MPENIEYNSYFDLAAKYINSTNCHLFLTGKAGTGKTTFLRHIRANCHKTMAVAAPTGVAAINAGGVTLHSLFQLPLGGFLPDGAYEDFAHGDFFNRKSLLRHLRLSKQKRQLLNDLELLVIDEVSMLRADLLDAIDTVLRFVRKKNNLPFGGVQMLFIGDLFQLPPVIKHSEWQILKKYYPSHAFFNAKALEGTPPIYIELKKIYRQSDQEFIDLLNSIRNGHLGSEEIDRLNKHFHPKFEPEKEGEYITLTTHNTKADVINDHKLNKLEGKTHVFTAEIIGEFNENSVKAEQRLRLKEGAQVMFLRNDKKVQPRYYNGKIGIVKRIDDSKIYVSCPDISEEILVEKETWENIRYKLNKETDLIEEDVKGTFTQYPIRLAWAMTVHKSQGLTFDKAIIDAGSSFAPGQVYVALSRLTSLDGLVLYSKIEPDKISVDEAAVGFGETEQTPDDLQTQLRSAQATFVKEGMVRAFDWYKLKLAASDFMSEVKERTIPEKDKAITLAALLSNKIAQQHKTAEKFIPQLRGLLEMAENDQFTQANARIKAAVDYFNKDLGNEVLSHLEKHLDTMKVKPRVKKYLGEVRAFQATVTQKINSLSEIKFIVEGMSEEKDLAELYGQIAVERNKNKAEQTKEEKVPKAKQPKGASQKLTLEMFKDGKSVEDIAETRSMAISTIQGHLVEFVGKEIELTQLVNETKAAQISQVMDSLGEITSLSEVKAKLGNEFTYGEIKAVLKDRQLEEQKG